MRFPVLITVLLGLAACAPHATSASEPSPAVAPMTDVPDGHKTAVVAGGCFWCIESDLEHLEGVTEVISGYAGGERSNPTYQQVSSHQTQHIEVVQVIYNPEVVTYEALTERFWHSIDPTQADGQFCDRGHQYTTAIFTSDPAERAIVDGQKTRYAEELGQTIATDIRDEATFWPAEDYHQDYYKKNASHYARYRSGCGRDRQVERVWGSVVTH
ncbi:MAG: peptide-methionine (S)-S-oxide reductase [Myxococcota bacterium]|jgi:peptide-methionine (S)-S-oxide reductase